MADPAEQVDGGGAAQTEDQPKGIDLTSPEIQDAIRQAVEMQTKDYKAKVSEFRDTTIATQKKLKEYEGLGMDTEQLRKIVENVSRNEEMKAVAEGNIDRVLELRTKPLRDDYEARLSAASEKIAELDSAHKVELQRNFDLRVSNEVAMAAGNNSDVHKDAIPLFVNMAKQVWHVESDGSIVPRDPKTGTRMISKDGKSDMGFDEWIASRKEVFPSLFKSPTGPGVRGGPGGLSNQPPEGLSGVHLLAWAREHKLTR